MNIFSEEDVPDIFWEISQDILESDAVKADSVRGPPADGRTSREYWRPSLTKAEWDLLNRTMDREIETSDKYIDEATKWLYANSKGQKVFAIYGIGDGTVPTPLYAVGWKKADVDYKRLTNFLEGRYNGIDKTGINFGRWLRIVPNKQGKSGTSVYANGNRDTAKGNDLVSGRTRKSNGAGDTRSREKNSSQEIKFSREHSLKVNTFLRHFTGEVREGEYIYLSNIEKATIKSNIKTGFGHIAPDAKRGIVSAHDRSKEYTYRFVCNADYSVTVTDVLDPEADKQLVDNIWRDFRNVHFSKESNGGTGSRQRNGNLHSDGLQKTQTVERTTEMAIRTPEGNRQRDSGPGGENRTNSGANPPRSAQEVTGKASREFVSTKDSQGRDLSKEQQEYFKDSKVRDEDGDLTTPTAGPDIRFSRELSQEAKQFAEDVRFSKKANWVPNLTKSERDMADYLVSRGRGTEFTANSRMFFEQSKGKTLFGIYSTDDSTLLYASRGEKAKSEHIVVEALREEYKNGRITDPSAKGLHTLAESIRLQRIADHGNGDGTAESGRLAGNGGVYGGKHKINASPALRNVLSNLLQEEAERSSGGEVRFSRDFVQGQLDQQQKQLEQVNAALEKENGKLREDNRYLQELVKLQKTVTNGTKFTKTSVIAAARMLKKKANVKHNANPAELVRLLEDFYGYIAKGDEITWESVMEAAQPAVGV